MTPGLLNQASKIFRSNFSPETCFERAIFLSWYCSKGDCKFCYMSTQKHRIRNPLLAKRTRESILAEAAIAKACGWRIEFLSGGYDSYQSIDLLSLIRDVGNIVGEKVWLNIGTLNEDELRFYAGHIRGVCGAVETINERLHAKLCPSKPLSAISSMFDICRRLGIATSMTIIIGLGEKPGDFDELVEFIKDYGVQRITFYALNPHSGTPFSRGPDPEYYADWIARTRIAFPELEIIAGTWANRVKEVGLLLQAGANSLTKFPAIKLFGSEPAKTFEQEAAKHRRFLGTLTKVPTITGYEPQVQSKIDNYLARMRKNKFL